LVGTYDCASFTQIDHGRTTTVRSIYDCVVRSPAPRRIEIEICASGFLYNMVRIVAGTLFEVGRGRIEPGAIPEIRDARDRTRAGPTLPPQGLCLRWIWYGAPRMKVGEEGEDTAWDISKGGPAVREGTLGTNGTKVNDSRTPANEMPAEARAESTPETSRDTTAE
jgi:tRNA U38,U39,U40 pseudouridine synthase TruA